MTILGLSWPFNLLPVLAVLLALDLLLWYLAEGRHLRWRNR